MDGPEAVVNLPDTDPERLADAVRAALVAQGNAAEEMRAGAEHTLGGDPGSAAARKFQTFLELGYLVASADGFAAQERSSLAHLLEHVTSRAVDHAALELHFDDLEQGIAQLGRRERLARAAAEAAADVGSAEHTIEVVATIAMADGTLSAAEYTVLVELGEHLGLQPEVLSRLVDDAAARVQRELSTR